MLFLLDPVMGELPGLVVDTLDFGDLAGLLSVNLDGDPSLLGDPFSLSGEEMTPVVVLLSG